MQTFGNNDKSVFLSRLYKNLLVMFIPPSFIICFINQSSAILSYLMRYISATFCIVRNSVTERGSFPIWRKIFWKSYLWWNQSGTLYLARGFCSSVGWSVCTATSDRGFNGFESDSNPLIFVKRKRMFFSIQQQVFEIVTAAVF